MNKIIVLILFLSVSPLLSFSQENRPDYSKVVFSSTIYKYKDTKPNTKSLGIDKKLVSDIIQSLSENIYDKKQQEDIINKVWLAFNDPKTFDFVYRDFAVKSNRNWSKVNANGELVLEPNPYLTEWTVNDDEFAYFQLVLNKILNHYSLISHGDDAEAVKSSLKKLLLTKNLSFDEPGDEDWAYSYLEQANAKLKKKGLVALVTKGHYDIMVCKINQKQKLTDLFKKMDWEFVAP